MGWKLHPPGRLSRGNAPQATDQCICKADCAENEHEGHHHAADERKAGFDRPPLTIEKRGAPYSPAAPNESRNGIASALRMIAYTGGRGGAGGSDA